MKKKKFMLIQMQQSMVVPLQNRIGLGLFDHFGLIMYHYLLSQRYQYSRLLYRKFALFDQFEMDLQMSDDEDGVAQFLSESEFRQKYRMSRESL